MYFGRELKGYAEPISAELLRPKGVYFAVQFLDDQMLVPVLEPLVFLGKNLRGGDKDRLYFQQFESYQAGLRLESAKDDDLYSFQMPATNGTNHIFEYENALDILMMCALKRREVVKD